MLLPAGLAEFAGADGFGFVAGATGLLLVEPVALPDAALALPGAVAAAPWAPFALPL